MLSERGKSVTFPDLSPFIDTIESKINNLTEEETALYSTSYEYYKILRNSNPMSYQKVMISIKAILTKVENSKKKTEKAKQLKKDKIQAKKDSGDFVSNSEFKKQKEEKLKKKAERRAAAKLKAETEEPKFEDLPPS
jgi:hypothetical protein